MTTDLNRTDNTAENIDLKYIAFKLQVMRTFMMAAISNTDLDAYEVSQMVRRQSSTVDDKALEKEKKDEGFEQLKEILVGDVADKTLENIDYKALQARILEVLVHTLNKGDMMVFEDKNIIDNALNLWAGLLQSQPGLFDDFIKMKDAKDILIKGLLLCKVEPVREQFKALLSNICKKQVKNTRKLEYVVNFLT